MVIQERERRDSTFSAGLREQIYYVIDMVDAVISWDDSDDSACGAIAKCLEISDSVIFCNGGDRVRKYSRSSGVWKRTKSRVSLWYRWN